MNTNQAQTKEGFYANYEIERRAFEFIYRYRRIPRFLFKFQCIRRWHQRSQARYIMCYEAAPRSSMTAEDIKAGINRHHSSGDMLIDQENIRARFNYL